MILPASLLQNRLGKSDVGTTAEVSPHRVCAPVMVHCALVKVRMQTYIHLHRQMAMVSFYGEKIIEITVLL